VGLEQGVERDRAGRGADPVADQRSERDRWHADGGQDGVHGSAQQVGTEHQRGPEGVADQPGQQQRPVAAPAPMQASAVP
jgi:hypothetical protein